MKSSAKDLLDFFPSRPERSFAHSWKEWKWALARILFHGYIGFSLATVVGGLLTAPVMTWYLFGDWRFWRHWHSAKGLFRHGYKMLLILIRGKNGGFMLDVPLTAPPHSSVNIDLVELQPDWEFGTACGPCHRCCTKINCPILDSATGQCQGYNSFFWRYFNCGRFPTEQREIDYYICPKWRMRDEPRRRGMTRREDEEMVA